MDNLNAILIKKGSAGPDHTPNSIFFVHGYGASHGITNVDGDRELKRHFGGEEADHTSNMGDHARCEQAGNDTTTKPAGFNKLLIYMVGVVITGDATEKSHITFRKSTTKGKRLPLLDYIKGGSELLLELGRCIWHEYVPFLSALHLAPIPLTITTAKRASIL
jgi:hypothetical protein